MSVELLPQNLNAEQAALASVLLHNPVADDVFAIVRPDQFYAESHQTIATEIQRLRSSGCDGIDPVTLAASLESCGKLQAVGGLAYLSEILESVPHALNARHYAEIVATKWRHRTAVSGLLGGLERLRGPVAEADIPAALAAAEQALHVAMENGETDEPQPIGNGLPAALAALSAGGGTQQTVTSGFESIDNHIGGLPLGGCTVVAARPSIGKTSLMLGMGLRIAEAGEPVMFASYEQTQRELTSRAISLVASVPLAKLMRGGLNSGERQRVADAMNQMANLPLLLDDSCSDESSLSARIRLAVRRRKVRAVIVDYLQLIPPGDRRQNREQQVAGLSRTLKLIGMQTGVAVVVASQLNRQSEQRDNKRPRLSDLRESGAIEQDADIVAFLHRPNKDDPTEADDHAELIVGKHRNGPCGSIRLGWQAEYAKYTDSPAFVGG